MPDHASLTGAQLHEPKGAASASVDTVYVADGAGSGAWAKIDANNIDTTSILNTNKQVAVISMADVSTADAVYIPFPNACTVTKITSIISAAITVADSTITCTNGGVTSLGTLTIAYSGSAEGTIDTLTPVANNTFSAGGFLKIATDGASTTTAKITFYVEFTLT